VLAGLFAIIQGAALVMGGALARSITYAVHELFIGTERVRAGDFTHRIRVDSQDQLGDLADSFNRMSGSIEHLLHVQREKQRLDDELRIAQISADEKRDFLLFMVQRTDDQVYFYFSTVREGLKKAFVSIPSKNLVMPLDRLEAEARFNYEVRYWGERIESK